MGEGGQQAVTHETRGGRVVQSRRPLAVNGHQYLVTLAPQFSGNGNILATITPEAPAGGTGTPANTAPEPSTLLLVALGMAPVMVLCRWAGGYPLLPRTIT